MGKSHVTAVVSGLWKSSALIVPGIHPYLILLPIGKNCCLQEDYGQLSQTEDH